MRLGILVTQLEMGGAQKAALVLARHFHETGHEVAVFFFYDKAGIAAEVQAQEPFEIIILQEFKGTPWQKLTNTMRGLWHLYRHLQKQHIEVLFALTRYSNALGPLVAKLAQVPVCVTSQRDMYLDSPWWLKWLEKTVVNSRLVDMMTAVSEEVAAFCTDQRGMSAAKIKVINNGVDLKRFQPPQTAVHYRAVTAPIIVTISRLYPPKGIRYLIAAAPEILAVYPQAKILIAGEGDERIALATQIDRLQLAEQVQLLGQRSDILALLYTADVFVLPSVSEGMSNALLEAMAAACPIVATAVGGTNSVMIDGQTGLLVPPQDTHALAQAILHLLQNPAVRQTLGKQAYTHVHQQFSQQQMFATYDCLFAKLLAKHTSTAK